MRNVKLPMTTFISQFSIIYVKETQLKVRRDGCVYKHVE